MKMSLILISLIEISLLLLLMYGSIIINEKEPVTDISMEAPIVACYTEMYYQFDYIVESLVESLSAETGLFTFALYNNNLGADSIYHFVKAQTDGTIDGDAHGYDSGTGYGFTQVEIPLNTRLTAFFRYVDGASNGKVRFMLFDPSGSILVNHSMTVSGWSFMYLTPRLTVSKIANVSASVRFLNFRALDVSRGSYYSSEDEAISRPFQTVPFNYGNGDYSWRQYELFTDGVWS